MSDKEPATLIEEIQSEFASGPRRFTMHALKEATADMLAVSDILHAVAHANAEIIEDYPDDPRGSCCLLLGWSSNGEPIHVIVTYPPDPAVITVYRPDPERWVEYKTRK